MRRVIRQLPRERRLGTGTVVYDGACPGSDEDRHHAPVESLPSTLFGTVSESNGWVERQTRGRVSVPSKFKIETPAHSLFGSVEV